jgi:Sec-independent protein translocase protein TatA
VAKRLGMGMREMKNAMGEVDPRRMLDPAEPPAPQPTKQDSRSDADG